MSHRELERAMGSIPPASHLQPGSEGEARYFCDSTDDLLALADGGGSFIRLNERWAEVLGHPTEELEGTPVVELFHPGDRDHAYRCVFELVEQPGLQKNLRKAVMAPSRFGATVSIGVASYPEHGSDGRTLLENADQALYTAKSVGRNCAVSAHRRTGERSEGQASPRLSDPPSLGFGL